MPSAKQLQLTGTIDTDNRHCRPTGPPALPTAYRRPTGVRPVPCPTARPTSYRRPTNALPTSYRRPTDLPCPFYDWFKCFYGLQISITFKNWPMSKNCNAQNLNPQWCQKHELNMYYFIHLSLDTTLGL